MEAEGGRDWGGVFCNSAALAGQVRSALRLSCLRGIWGPLDIQPVGWRRNLLVYVQG